MKHKVSLILTGDVKPYGLADRYQHYKQKSCPFLELE